MTWDETKHKRGQPENAGQFGPGGVGADAKHDDARAVAKGHHAKHAVLDEWVTDDIDIQDAARQEGRVATDPRVRAIDAAIDDAPPLPEGSVVYRGLEFDDAGMREFLSRAKKGHSFSYGGFSAVSSDRQVAERFAQGASVGSSSVLLEITMTSPTRAAPIDSDLHEFLLRRGGFGQSFRVTGMRRTGKSVVVQCSFVNFRDDDLAAGRT